MLTVTEEAAQKIKGLLLKEGKDPDRWALRIGVEGGGCSGLKYRMEWSRTDGSDSVYERDGARVVIDPKSLLFVAGSTLEYTEALTGAGFVIKNPNATTTCGCGDSFSV